MLLKVSNYNSLRSEREVLKREYRSLEKVVSATNVKLGSLESLATEVALTYGFDEVRRARFPEGALALATEKNATPESALYTFNLMKKAALNPSGEVAALDLFASPHLDPATIPSIWPVRGLITAGFGQRMDPFSGEGSFHAGLDISAPYGTGVEAAAEGLVFYAGPDQGYGNEILIDHGYGIKTKYGHLSQISVVVGQEVNRGQVIGAVGTSGKATGPHLHYEVLVQETPVNPSRFLHG
jgi:murein DD-endopeptidase MepM/ murein hydrolase activator NlpD